MRRAGRVLFLFLALIAWVVPRAFASEVGDVYFKSGVQKYLKGDSDAALKDLETGYGFDKENTNLRAFYAKILAEKGSAFYADHNLPEAMSYLTKARELVPDDPKILEMFALVSSELTPRASPAARVERAAEPQRVQRVASLAASYAKDTEKLLETYLVPIRQLIEQQNKEQEKMIKRTFYFSATGVVLGVAATLFLVFLIIHRLSVQRESMIMNSQQNILNRLMETNALPGAMNSYALEGPESAEEGTSPEGNPRRRERHMDIIDAELVEDADREMAYKLLLPFLKDNDNRVRAKAARSVYKYDQKLALDTLRGMCTSDDKWSRVSGIWALSELKDPEAAEIILEVIHDPEYHVKRMALKGIKGFVMDKSGKFDEVLQEKMLTVLTDVKVKEGWII